MPLKQHETALLTKRVSRELQLSLDSPRDLRDLCKLVVSQTMELLSGIVSLDAAGGAAPPALAKPEAQVQVPQQMVDQTEGALLLRLLRMPEATFVNARELGGLLERHPRTILRSAQRGELPPAFRFMGRQGWTVGSIAAWLQAKQTKAQNIENKREASRQRLRP